MPLLEQAHTHGPAVTHVPDQSRAERRRSFDVADFPMPTGREEEWRFTPVDRLGALLRDEPTGQRLARDTHLPAGVGLGTMSVGDWQATAAALAGPPADRAAAISAAHSGGVAVLDIPADLVVEEPVRITLSGEPAGPAASVVHGHLFLRIGAHAKATVLLGHVGHAAYSEMLTVEVGDGAELTVVSLQEWADESVHLAQHAALVGRDAAYTHIAVTLGGAIVRLNVDVRYAAPGGTATALGLYFADAGQHLEHRLFVDHEPPHCRSHVEYKGALQGDTAHTVWVGDVLIRAGAEGTLTYELNRNLVLTDGARADSVPNLEIETGQILGAGHASATGRFDDEQLFYLQARGIPESEARRLVVRGFFADLVARIPVADLQGHLMAAVERELSRSIGAEPTEPTEVGSAQVVPA